MNIQDLYHTEILPAPAGVALIGGIYNLSVAVAELLINGNVPGGDPVFPVPVIYIKGRSPAITGFEVDQRISAGGVGKEITGYVILGYRQEKSIP